MGGYYDWFWFGRDTKFAIAAFNANTGSLDLSIGSGGIITTDYTGHIARAMSMWSFWAFGSDKVYVNGYVLQE